MGERMGEELRPFDARDEMPTLRPAESGFIEERVRIIDALPLGELVIRSDQGSELRLNRFFVGGDDMCEAQATMHVAGQGLDRLMSGDEPERSVRFMWSDEVAVGEPVAITVFGDVANEREEPSGVLHFGRVSSVELIPDDGYGSQPHGTGDLVVEAGGGEHRVIDLTGQDRKRLPFV
jgi:hypothetical protein